MTQDRCGGDDDQSSSDEPRGDQVDVDDDAPPPTQTHDFGDPGTPAFQAYVRAEGSLPMPVLPRPDMHWQDLGGGSGSADVTPRTQMWSNFVGLDQMSGYGTMGAAGASSSAQAAWGPSGQAGAESSAQAERRVPSPAEFEDLPPGGVGQVPVPPAGRTRSRRGRDQTARVVRGRHAVQAPAARGGQRLDPGVQHQREEARQEEAAGAAAKAARRAARAARASDPDVAPPGPDGYPGGPTDPVLLQHYQFHIARKIWRDPDVSLLC